MNYHELLGFSKKNTPYKTIQKHPKIPETLSKSGSPKHHAGESRRIRSSI